MNWYFLCRNGLLFEILLPKMTEECFVSHSWHSLSCFVNYASHFSWTKCSTDWRCCWWNWPPGYHHHCCSHTDKTVRENTHLSPFDIGSSSVATSERKRAQDGIKYPQTQNLCCESISRLVWRLHNWFRKKQKNIFMVLLDFPHSEISSSACSITFCDRNLCKKEKSTAADTSNPEGGWHNTVCKVEHDKKPKCTVLDFTFSCDKLQNEFIIL